MMVPQYFRFPFTSRIQHLGVFTAQKLAALALG